MLYGPGKVGESWLSFVDISNRERERKRNGQPTKSKEKSKAGGILIFPPTSLNDYQAVTIVWTSFYFPFFAEMAHSSPGYILITIEKAAFNVFCKYSSHYLESISAFIPESQIWTQLRFFSLFFLDAFSTLQTLVTLYN